MKQTIIPEHHFEELSRGFGDPDAIKILQQRENAIRLYQLSGLLPGSEDNMFKEAWDVFVQTDGQVKTYMESPMFGAWLNSAMEAREYAPNRLPLELQYMANYAIAATFQNGGEAELPVATHNGRVALPGLGRTAFLGLKPAQASVANGELIIVHAGQQIILNHDDIWQDGPNWDAARFVAPGVLLDDLDPHRKFSYPVPDRRTTGQEHDLWVNYYHQAMQFLQDAHPRFAEGLAAGLKSIVPAGHAPLTQGRSMANGAAFGAAAITTPYSIEGLASHLVNSFVKSKLLALRVLSSADDLVRDRNDPVCKQRLQVPSREAPGVPSYLLDDAYTNSGIAGFFNALRQYTTDPNKRAYAEMSFARWYDEAQRSADLLRQSGYLLELGDIMLAYLQDELDSLGDTFQTLPQEAKQAACLSAKDADINWRLHNLRPDPGAIAHLTYRWRNMPQSGTPIAVATTIVTSRETYTFTGRRTRWVLAGAKQMEPDTFQALLRGENNVAMFGPIQPGDLAFANGDLQVARDIYRAAIQRNPDDKQAWAGFILTHQNQDDQVSRLLAEQPAAVARFYAAIGDTNVEPEEAAKWLAQNIL